MTQRDSARITLRLPTSLSNWVQAGAKERGISANAQIKIILHEKMTDEAAGGEIGVRAPAAGSEPAAL